MNQPQKQEEYCQCDATGGTGFVCSICHKRATFDFNETEPQQQESYINRFDKKYKVSKDDDLITTTRYALLQDISTERQRVLEEVRKLVEGMKVEVLTEISCSYNRALGDLLSELKEMEDK